MTLARKTLAIGGAAALVVLTAASALAVEIENPAGPLTRIQTTEDLNCDVAFVVDDYPEFYARTACGTFLSTGDTVYGPERIPGGAQALDTTPFAPLDQSLSGSGSATDPFLIHTEVAAGPDLVVHQDDSYVVGDTAYRTDLTVINTGAVAVDVVLYHAGDCFLADSDLGFGRVEPELGLVSCVAANPNTYPPEPGTRVEQFAALSPDSNYLYATYFQVWSAIDSGEPLPDECRDCDRYRNNAMAMSWTATLEPGASTTRSLLTSWTPLGLTAITSETTADRAVVPPGGDVGIEVTFTNDNDETVPVRDLTVVLPAQWRYVRGSTTGGLSADPVDVGGTLVWTGPLDLAADGGGGFGFTLTAPASRGPALITFDGADAGAIPVIGSDVPLVVQTGADLAVSLEVDPPAVLAGESATWVATATNEGPEDATLATVELRLPPESGEPTEVLAPEGWTCLPVEQSLVCDVDSFPAGGSAVLAVSAAVSADSTEPVADGLARVSSEVADPDVSDNEATAQLAVGRAADLVVSLQGPTQGEPGSRVMLSATVVNRGPSSARSVVATFTNGWEWELGDLAPGERLTRDVEITLPPSGTYSLGLEATARDVDPYPADNADVLAIDVQSGSTPAPTATLPPTGAGAAGSVAAVAAAVLGLGAGLLVVARRRLGAGR